ncbi:MAG: hypothetical protein DLM63_00880 [Solirubrobacterales bacterium]|nr:MAG: hypothetical protein DLM63_00880 [Solirubrobacterales bacterium]
MDIDLSRLRTGEKLAAACAALLFVDMFLHWFRASASISSANPVINEQLHANPVLQAVLTHSARGADAWTAFSVIDLLLLLTIVVTLGMVVVAATQRSVGFAVIASVIATPLGALSTLFVLIDVLISKPGGWAPPQASISGLTGSFRVTTQVFGWLGLLLTAGLTVGAYLAMRDERVSVRDARAQAARLLSGPPRPAPIPRRSPSSARGGGIEDQH